MSVADLELHPMQPRGGDGGHRTAGLALARVNFRDAFYVWQRHLEVYLRLWKVLLLPPLIEPVFSIFAFGWGVGSLIIARVEGIPTYVRGCGALALL